MSTYVLVHGAWHGGWCWQRVAPLLEARGHRALAPDLPGHGEMSAPVSEMTLASYTATVKEAIEAAGEPVVLVGHSMGGMIVTQVAEYVPERIRMLAYLTAALPADGQSGADMLATFEGPKLIETHMIADEEAGTCVVEESALRSIFYGECTDDDVAFATKRLVPESLDAMAAPVRITPGRAGSVPRTYIECLRDQAIVLALQRHMQEALPCEAVLQVDSDHSPFLSRPAQLAEQLLKLA